MHAIQAKIRHCYYLLNLVHILLYEALALANYHDYDAHWIAAINTAIHDNDKAWLQTHNIATCIDPTTPLTPPKEP